MTTRLSDTLDMLTLAVALALSMALVALLTLAAPWPPAAMESTAQDFTDTGVGCIDDCLDPADLQADRETLDEDEQGRPCTFQTCQD